ncbi:MAG: DUF1311 domain-containing protein [Caulobacter sp.]|nr:DUF1311 domain-containing protein [Caulobacter sp.]
MRNLIVLMLLMGLGLAACGQKCPVPQSEGALRVPLTPEPDDNWMPLECVGDCAVAERGLRPSYKVCLDKSGGITSLMIDCMNVEYRYQEHLLNQTFQRVRSKASPSRRVRLEDSQAAWREAEDLRARDVGFQSGTGSGGWLIMTEASVMLVVQRRADLERFEAGDLKAPARP